MIRRSASRGVMVWDRERKGPAMFNGQPAIGLTDAQAVEIKIELKKLHFR
jgi:hypothetical protein